MWIVCLKLASAIHICAASKRVRSHLGIDDDERVLRPEEPPVLGCSRNDTHASFWRPRDESGPNVPLPCVGSGLVLRRDMGSLGVTSFQQIYGALAADALGPRFSYFDQWSHASYHLRPGLQIDRNEGLRLVQLFNERPMLGFSAKPTKQAELETKPWDMTGVCCN